MSNKNWAKELGINGIMDVNSFLDQASADANINYFIEINKRLSNQKGLRTLLSGLVPSLHEADTCFRFIHDEVDTIFTLKENFDSFNSLVYYLVDDECLGLAEIDYDTSGRILSRELTCKHSKLQVFFTGLWNTDLNNFDFFNRYLTREINDRRSLGMWDELEVTKVNETRFHNFNNSDGVEDFVAFIRYVGDRVDRMTIEYDRQLGVLEQEHRIFDAGPTHHERCTDIISSYLNSVSPNIVLGV